MSGLTFDAVITNGRWFDGTGGPSAIRNIGIRDGRVAAVTPAPLEEDCPNVIDAQGKWVIPGIIDRVGDWADLAVIDPQRLDESLDSYHEADVAAYGGLSRMVNRNDQTVTAVFVSGREVFRDGQPTEILSRERTGGFLRPDGRPRNVPRPVPA